MGTSDYSAATNTGDWDHPHAYGDKFEGISLVENAAGSSPRVWGQVKNRSKDRHQWGIIPTRMGTRKLYPKDVKAYKDHPHAYGDKLKNLGHPTG